MASVSKNTSVQEVNSIHQSDQNIQGYNNTPAVEQDGYTQSINNQYNIVVPQGVQAVESNQLIQPQESELLNNQSLSIESNTNPIGEQPRRASALSLTSIRNRKELASSLEKVVINPDDLPKQAFTYDQLMGEWNYYIDRLTRSGLMLMASLMRMAQPTLFEARIELELPNEGSKLSFEENKYDLVNYLRKKLQNFAIELNITVNEEIKLVKRVLDSKDKYQHFIEINPEVEVLKDIFDLELK